MAGEATSRSMGSNMRLVVSDSWMISPLMRQSWRGREGGREKVSEGGREMEIGGGGREIEEGEGDGESE